MENAKAKRVFTVIKSLKLAYTGYVARESEPKWNW